MMIEHIFSKIPVESSNNEDLIFNGLHIFNFDNNTFHFHFSELLELKELEEKVSTQNFSLICSNIIGIKKGLFSYKSIDSLKLYYGEFNDLIVIFAIGEFQPTLFKIQVECIFKKNYSELCT